jgi:hypothetical protein
VPQVQDFLDLHPNVGVSNLTRQSALNTIDNTIKWMNQYRDTVGNWLLANAVSFQSSFVMKNFKFTQI